MKNPVLYIILSFVLCFLLTAKSGRAEDVYQTTRHFLKEIFQSSSAEEKLLWITNDMKPDIRQVLGHDYPALRIRYWKHGNTTAWVLEEIGKTKPITTGIAIKNQQILSVKVLTYRESHGWEVKYPFFTGQFHGITLKENKELSSPIDGIAGATLSVDALTRLGRLALLLDRYAQKNEALPQ